MQVVPYVVSKFYELWSTLHKRLKVGPEFLYTGSILLRPQSIAHSLNDINVAPHDES